LAPRFAWAPAREAKAAQTSTRDTDRFIGAAL
jgi:hypothetical protein